MREVTPLLRVNVDFPDKSPLERTSGNADQMDFCDVCSLINCRLSVRDRVRNSGGALHANNFRKENASPMKIRNPLLTSVFLALSFVSAKAVILVQTGSPAYYNDDLG